MIHVNRIRRPHILAAAETAGNKQPPLPSAPAKDDIALLDEYSRTIVSAVDRVAPSVVNIESRANGSRGGSGSGFIIAPDGFILTNSHVVHGAREIVVNLSDGRESRAQLVGDDPDTDLAVIRPAQGICFAIASNTAKFVAGWLIKEGRIRRGYIGVAGQTSPLHRRVARFYHLANESGAMVVSVEKGSPAEQSRIRPDDVIVAFNDEPIASVHDLHKKLVGDRIGTPSKLTVLRGTEQLTIYVTPAEMPALRAR